jgi:hypothetical protein
VDIHKVFCDGTFAASGVRDVIDRHDMSYLFSKQKYGDRLLAVRDACAGVVSGITVPIAIVSLAESGVVCQTRRVRLEQCGIAIHTHRSETSFDIAFGCDVNDP